MKPILLLLFIAFFNLSSAQTPFSLTQGNVTEKDYFTTIHYEEIKEKIIIEGIINGKIYKFILDTGAPMVVSKKLSDELKLQSMRNIEIVDQSSLKDSANVVLLPNIKIGNINFNNIPAIVTKESIFDCFGIDGLIGSNLLKNSIIQFSSREKIIRITDVPKKLDLKSKTGAKLLLDAQSNPFIWIEQVNGKVDAREQLLFDTGMGGLYDLSINHYKKHFEKINLFNFIAQSVGTFSMGFHGNAEANENYKLLLPELAVNKIIFKNVTTTTTYDQNSRIGATLLKYGTVTVDYKNRKFYFEPFEETKSFDIAEKEWPFNAILEDGKMKIGIVWDKTYDEKIKVGDQIIAIGDINYEKMSFCEIVISDLKNLKIEKTVLILKDKASGETKKVEITRK